VRPESCVAAAAVDVSVAANFGHTVGMNIFKSVMCSNTTPWKPFIYGSRLDVIL